MFAFLRRRKLRRHALADADWQAASSRLAFIEGMDDAEQALLRERATLFLADKIVAPAADFSLTADQAIEIAIWAALPVLHRGLDAYAGFHGLIVYPDEFLAPREDIDEAGVVHVGHERVAGESWDAGPILVSWADVEHARRRGQGSVVIHECAHKLDQGDGELNGVPALAGTGISGAQWTAVMRSAWERMREEERSTGTTRIDDYALESPAEFFAVLSEEFFTAPLRLGQSMPEVHTLLARYYRVEPANWWRSRRSAPRRAVASRGHHVEDTRDQLNPGRRSRSTPPRSR